MTAVLRCLLCGIALLGLGRGASASWSDFVLAGSPKCNIVIGENASDAEVLAAKAFHDLALEMTGASIPTLRDDSFAIQYNETDDTCYTRIVVAIGRTRWLSSDARKELRIGERLPDNDPMRSAYLIHRSEQYVVLAGQDDLGTLYAVHDFLSRFGVKFSPQGPEATIVPKREHMQTAGIGRAIVKPDVACRKQFAWLAASTSPRPAQPPAPRAVSCPFIVRDGKAASVIVAGRDATVEEMTAVEELRKYVRRMTGVELPVRRDNDAAPDAGQLVISVGRTLYVPDDLRKELKIGENVFGADPIHDGFALVKTPGLLCLVGHRDRGSAYAVFELLGRFGCRWFFGSEAGTVIPKEITNLELKETRLVRIPDFAIRYVYYWWGHWQDGADRVVHNYWHLTNQLSEGDMRGYEGHNYDQILPAKLHATHPEYFSMVRGKRTNPATDNWQMCLSNRDVIKLSAEWGEARLARDPSCEMLTYFQNDGYGLCECPECRKIGNHLDVILYFSDEVRKLLEPRHPGIRIGAIAYATSAVVPEKVKAEGYDRNQDKTIIAIWENSKVTPWLKVIAGAGGASHNVFVDKCWNPITHTTTRPVYYKDSFSEYPFYKSHGVLALRLQAVTNWAANGLDIYISRRLMWDASADPKAIVDDFAQRMFPSCTPEFTEYLKLYDEKAKSEMRCYFDDDRKFFFNEEQMKTALTWPQWLAGSLDILERMRLKIRTPEEKKRWQFYALYMHLETLEYASGRNPCKTPPCLPYLRYYGYTENITQENDEARGQALVDLVAVLKASKASGLNIALTGMCLGKEYANDLLETYPGRDLKFMEIPPLPINDEGLQAIFQKDRAKYPATLIRKAP